MIYFNNIVRRRVVLRNLCQPLIPSPCNPWQSGGTDVQQMMNVEKELALNSNVTVKMVSSARLVW